MRGSPPYRLRRTPAPALALLAGLLVFGVMGVRARAPAEPAPPAESLATLVLYNTRDPESRALATLYAEGRSIPEDHVVGLDCSLSEEITRSEYDGTVAWPLRKIFTDRKWWTLKPGTGPSSFQVVANHIRFIAAMRGMPLKVKTVVPPPPPATPAPSPARTTLPTPTPKPAPTPVPPMARDEASLDAELAVLGLFATSNEGPLNNPYYRSFTRFLDAPLPTVMLVGRIDAPTADIARRMIADALAAERGGLDGWGIFDTRGLQAGSYQTGDNWIRDAAADARAKGVPALEDRAGPTLPPGLPLPPTALYFGWYTWNLDGPFLRADFAFEPGAVACHLHSFSAETLRDPARAWCGPLLAKGAAATVGNVYEPYLDLTANFDVLLNRLFNGFTLAEAAFASIKSLSWMHVTLGDPLYRPFARWNDLAAEPSGRWVAYRRAMALRTKDPARGDELVLKLAREEKRADLYEALGHLRLADGDLPKAKEAFAAALKLKADRERRARIAYFLIRATEQTEGKEAAIALLDEELAACGDTPGAEALRALDREYRPPPPPSPTPGPSGSQSASPSMKNR